MNLRPAYLLFVVLLIAAVSAQARFAMVEVKQVPLARLIDNLAASARAHPEQPQYRLNLARAYTMAYALNSDQGELSVHDEGHNSLTFAPTYSLAYKAFMPTKVSVTRSIAARAFLAEAIKLYERLVRENDADPYLGARARLGYAWSSEQNGDKQTAMAGYRVLVNEAHATDSIAVPGLDWWDSSAEAAGYLVALLDPVDDAEEIALLRRRLADFRQKPRAITPIAIPLKKETTLAEMEDRAARVTFDADGRNVGQAWSWITPKAGWLAYDPKQTRKIDSAIRLFGNVSYWMFWENGYDALVVVWIDQDGDGVCAESEVKTLAQLDIVGLRYSHVPLAGHPDRIVYAPQGVLYRDGSNGPSFDIVLHARP